ncbi:MAG TPA: FAD:protein FMN transferase [Planctomycetota bacterium]|nr:FAD:protein FMN transferase ApbE [Planctomycetota bacterium]MDP6128361.1 FAD:protein FMN transferase [Planctomycetota bacterium]MDP7559315.1 FAD:protein FMN transferase [Planctomycetota bacterium]HJM38639.1 FAD:protein FMN transferase [Planctomycetota bacterium]|tara:strand:+ start:31494 stop:32546 length:1053 start_codon:yes stop_codon:yes gene_type:complete
MHPSLSPWIQTGGYVTACLLFLSCGRSGSLPSQDIQLTGSTMGTVWHAKLPAGPKAVGSEWKPFQAATEHALAEVDGLMSTYKPASDLSIFNRAPAERWVPVSPLTLKVTLQALAWAEKTEGAFDPTVMPLVNAWSFGPTDRRTDAPTEKQLRQIQKLVGYQHIQVRESPPALKKNLGGVELDFSAIAKGFGVDFASAALVKAGAEAFMLEVGGELVVQGQKPNRTPWKIEIEQPNDDASFGSSSQIRVELASGQAMATSGDYRNYRVVDGKRISHTIDPRSGRPIEHNLASVSILAQDCTTADALATAVMVLGPEKGMELIESLSGVACLLILRVEEGFEKKPSSNWPS